LFGLVLLVGGGVLIALADFVAQTADAGGPRVVRGGWE
jgi:hypothetical protein